ncbi:DMT family transporter [Flectobacillus major]|uniref:DMT family transporter n=1 Tax=Flectobacillus major TaxID=103 RepID=UPI00040A7D21|nr:multidrug resistance efflux transporter family protein [Flectobacillus major]
MKPSKNLAIVLGLLSSLFFAFTFIINRKLSITGGSWVWSASLRFYWMLPFFLAIVVYRKNFHELVLELRKNLKWWLLWSSVGFGIFYSMLTFAASFGPSWLIASTWQFTIIAGMIVSLFVNKTQNNQIEQLKKPFLFSGIILLGIAIMQITHAQSISMSELLLGLIPVLIASFAYPIGNRKMMQLVDGKLDVYQRILGMILCSMPFWILLSGFELLINHVTPPSGQLVQTFIVAVCSGVIATILFFTATDMVRSDEKQLATIEATQSAEVIFTLIGEMLFLSVSFPNNIELLGIALVMIGMILHAIK